MLAGSDLQKIWGDGWRPLMDRLVASSLVERRLSPGGKAEHFSTLPVLTEYAASLLTEEEREFRIQQVIETFYPKACRLYGMLASENPAAVRELLPLGCRRSPPTYVRLKKRLSPESRPSQRFCQIRRFSMNCSANNEGPTVPNPLCRLCSFARTTQVRMATASMPF